MIARLAWWCRVVTRAAAVVVVALPLGAQELDVLELDDFLDPHELKSSEARGGAYHFLASRVYVGAAERHNFRGDFIKSRVHFGRLATVFYAGQWQLTAKLTDYDTRTHREPPYFRSRAQVARYFGGGESGTPVRAQLSWTTDVSRTEGAHNEWALDLSTTVRLPAVGRPIVGGMVYSVDRHRARHYAGFSAQVPIVRWQHESSIRLGASVAQDRARASQLLARSPNLYKAIASLAIGIPGTEARLYAAYSPAYRTQGRTWNHEVTVMLDATVISRLFR